MGYRGFQIEESYAIAQSPVKRVLRLLGPHRKTVGFLLGLVFIACSLDLAVPFLTQHVIDAIVRAIRESRSIPTGWLVQSAATIFVAIVLTRGIRSIYNYRLFKLISGVEDRIKRAAYSNFLSLDIGTHNKLNSGQIIGALDRGSTAMFIVLYEVFGQNLATSILMFIGVIGALLCLNPIMALAVFAPMPIYVFLVSRATKRMRQLESEVSHRFETVSKECYDIASNIATVKNFLQEHSEIENQRKLTDEARKTQYSAELTWATIENVQTWLSTLGRVIVIALGGYLAMKGQCTIGQYVLLISLQDMLVAPMNQLSILLPKLRRNLARSESMFDILDKQSKLVDAPHASELQPLRHMIEFRDVSFHYEGSERQILNHVNLKIPVGSTVALIGRSGTGKSTLAKLLLRCYDAQQGSILIDGVDIRNVTQASLRRQIAVVSQEVDLFSRTVAENIAYGCPDATLNQIKEAAHLALAHDFIMRCEGGYESMVGERGLRLSGGERQRIGIARAILQDPEILILDEATSHLDSESERLIQQATEELTRGRTCFMIAHRLSTVKHADIVVVFGDHGIEAIGNHQNLWAQSETYRKLMAASNMDHQLRPELVETAAA